METIDSHIHIFNLKYLPVAGILRRLTTTPKFKHPIIANAIGNFLVGKTRSIFTDGEPEAFGLTETDDVETISKRLNLVDFERPLSQIALETPEQLFSMKKEDLSNLYCAMLEESDLQDVELTEALNHFTKNIEGNAEGFALTSGSEAFDIPDLEHGLETFTRMFKWLFDQIDEVTGIPLEGIRYLQWFSFMLNSETKIIDQIINYDSNGLKSVDLDKDGVIDSGIKQYLFLMMDVDYFFNHPGDLKFKSSFDFVEKQIPYMAELIRQYEGKLIGFVAFNPMRPNCMEIVEDAINKHGFKGIKIYPPMGYKPHYDVPKNDFEKTVKEKTTLLYEYCITKDIPLYTHTNNSGFEANPQDSPEFALGDLWPSGYCANPKYWYQVLKQYEKLRLNLGHAGGTHGWFAPPQATDHTDAELIDYTHIADKSEIQASDWNKSHAAMAFKLCEKFENVYCDFSFLDDMVNTDGTLDKAKSDIFRDRLVELLKSSKRFSKKIMYGSDWHMLLKEGKNAVYYKAYQTFFSDPLLQPYAKDFFEDNAKRYLKQIKVEPTETVVAEK
jgi:predicted TIM-barrel fold metal-dependent hydrolase